MRRATALTAVAAILFATLATQPASGYLADLTLPAAGGCPALDRWNISAAQPLNRRWSISLPLAPVTILTVAAQNSSAQLTEIENTLAAAFGAWSGVSGTTFNATNYPAVIGPLTRASTANACSNDSETNIDGLNTICFNQSSIGFTTGVLAFTRVITANAPGASVGSGPPAAFAGQFWTPTRSSATTARRLSRHLARFPPRKARAPTISNRFSRTNWAIGSALIIPPFGAP